jgi:hypothetical protein
MRNQTKRHHEAEITKAHLWVSALLILVVCGIAFVHSSI